MCWLKGEQLKLEALYTIQCLNVHDICLSGNLEHTLDFMLWFSLTGFMKGVVVWDG